MIRKTVSILLIASVSLSLTGCFSGRTSVTASRYATRPYDIYLNGKHICEMSSEDDCSFQTRGTRAGGLLEAQLDGRVIGSTNIHREITMLSILFSPVTFLTSIWLYRAYPDEIEIPIDPYILRDCDNGNKETVSVWDLPYSAKNSKKAAKSVETSSDESVTETDKSDLTSQEPRAVRGEDAAPQEEPATVKKSVWD